MNVRRTTGERRWQGGRQYADTRRDADLPALAPGPDLPLPALRRAGRAARGLPDRARAGHGSRRRLRLGRAVASSARGLPARDRARDRSRRGVARPGPSPRCRAGSRGPRDLRGARRARRERPVRRGHVHRGVPDLGARREEAQPLDYGAALTALRALLPRGGRLVYGEGIWSAPPSPAATAPLAGRDDEYVTLAELVALAEAHGFGVLAAHEASLDEWDTFESGFTAGWVRWLAEHRSTTRTRTRSAPAWRASTRRTSAAIGASWAWRTSTWWRCERRDRAGRRRRPRPGHGRRPGGHRQRRPRRRAPRYDTAETFLLDCRDREGEGPDAGSGLADDDSRLVGYAALTSTASRTSTAPSSSVRSIPTTGAEASVGRWRRRPRRRLTARDCDLGGTGGCRRCPGWATPPTGRTRYPALAARAPSPGPGVERRGREP